MRERQTDLFNLVQPEFEFGSFTLSTQARRWATKIELPGQKTELGFYSIIDHMQQKLATAAFQASTPLDPVPNWCIQIVAYLLACRIQSDRELTRDGFMSFAEDSRKYGSQVFARSLASPIDSAILRECAELVRHYGAGDLLVLLGRCVDYGRTAEWEVKSGALVKQRNLASAKSSGMFYTPSFVARYLARRCLADWQRTSPPRVCDPCVGGGILLLGAAEVLLEKYDSEQVIRSLYGVDTDPIAAEVAALAIASMCGMWKPGDQLPLLREHILVGDSFGDRPQQEATALPTSVDWSNSFPEVFSSSNAGFDLVLINPPFGRHKVDSDWLEAKEMRFEAEDFADLRKKSRHVTKAIRASGAYDFSLTGVLDKSRIGLERAMQLTRLHGILGAIIPTTINADSHSQQLRKHLLYQWKVEEINEFPEGARLFFEVNQSVSVLRAKKGLPTTAIAVRSGIADEFQLAGPFRAEWHLSTIERLSPTLAIPVRAGNVEDLLEQMHRHPRVAEYTWITNARGEIDVSAFREAITSESGEATAPLVRGEQIDSYRGNLATNKPANILRNVVVQRLAGSPKLRHFEVPRIVGRQCSYLYRQQRLSFALVAPHRYVANSCNYLIIEDDTLRYYVLALLNSQLMNWRFRLLNSNNHVANSEIDTFPIPDPWTASGELLALIVRYVERLSINYDPVAVQELDTLVFELFDFDSSQRQRVIASHTGAGT